MEYEIRFTYDDEAEVWIAVNDELPLALESESLDQLISEVQLTVPEMVELNHLEKPKYLNYNINRKQVFA